MRAKRGERWLLLSEIDSKLSDIAVCVEEVVNSLRRFVLTKVLGPDGMNSIACWRNVVNKLRQVCVVIL